MAEKVRKIKVSGDRPVDSRYRPGGFTPGVEYTVSEQEAKELVNAKLAYYANEPKSEKKGA